MSTLDLLNLFEFPCLLQQGEQGEQGERVSYNKSLYDHFLPLFQSYEINEKNAAQLLTKLKLPTHFEAEQDICISYTEAEAIHTSYFQWKSFAFGNHIIFYATNLTALVDKTNLLNTTIENLPGNYWWKDTEGIYRGYNKNLLKLLGLNHMSEVIGKSDYDLPWRDDAKALYDNDDLVMRSDEQCIVEEKVITADGEEKVFLVIKSPYKNANNELLGTIGTSVDITKQKRLEAQLLRSNKAKSEFIANMSHDLRTPITGMLGMLQEILNAVGEYRASPQSDHQQLIDLVERDSQLLIGATDELLQLYNEILDVVRLEAGEEDDVIETFSLPTLVSHNIDLLIPAAIYKKLNLSFHISPQVPKYLKGSRVYLDRILLNLISNGLKFTDSGEVSVNIDLVDNNKNNNKDNKILLKIVVEDSGIGIPDDKFEFIFEHFARLAPAYEGLYKGAGLGLYTVKRYVTAMKGDIEVHSKEGEGSCFTLLIPFELGNKDDVTVPQLKNVNVTHKSTVTSRILIVEDHVVAATALEIALKPYQCEVDVAPTGEEAIRLASKNHYELIFMDIGLPDKDGIEVTKAIRALNNHKAHVPIVALTGHADDASYRQIALDAGMQKVLSKPIKTSELESVFHSYIFNQK